MEFGKIKRCETPSKAYIGLKAEDIENNEIRAEEFSEPTSKDEAEVDLLKPALDGQGRFVVQRGNKAGNLPGDTEELRARLTL